MTTVPALPGGIGLWAGFLDRLSTPEAMAFVQQIEAAGVATVWLQEYGGVDPFVRAALYLSATQSLTVALGVAVIYGRDAAAMVAAASTLEEAFPGRFVLGLGVSHRELVETRGHEFGPPLATMKHYLASMDRVSERRRLPPRILGALGPKMVELAGISVDGVHTYFSPVAHTASARVAIGPDRWLAPSQMVALTGGDNVQWREHVRSYLQLCLGMPNYRKNLLRFGLTQDDLATTSDALVDSLVVPDEPSLLQARVDEQQVAGADHVVLQFVPPPPARVIRHRLAAGFPSLAGRPRTPMT
jgi:probable F420-dependent oxidoreductase